MKLDKLELGLALVLPFTYFQSHYYYYYYCYYEGLFLCQICLYVKIDTFLLIHDIGDGCDNTRRSARGILWGKIDWIPKVAISVLIV